MAKVAIHQGEAKLLPFRIVDKRTGKALDLTGATFLLWVKRSPEEEVPSFVKADTDFTKTAVAIACPVAVGNACGWCPRAKLLD